MNIIKKNILFLLLLCNLTTQGVDYVTITAPAQGATVSGAPLSISGTSSQANYRVRLKINTTEIGSATTDGSGNWAFSATTSNGSRTITADLMSSLFETVATSTNSCTIQNPATITITTPQDNDAVLSNPATVVGTTSASAGLVNLSLDGTLVTTATADTSGNWQAAYTLTTNDTHTLMAQLMVLGSPVASASVDIMAAVPVIFPTGKSQIRVINGNVPTTGSGSGSGFTYSVSGSIVTINFVPAFSSVPSIIATGLRASGSSTVTLSSVTTTAASTTFSTGTQRIYFTASALA